MAVKSAARIVQLGIQAHQPRSEHDGKHNFGFPKTFEKAESD